MLGSDFDIVLGIAPVNLSTGANTGARHHMGDAEAVVVLFVGGAGAASEPPVLTLKQHTAVTAGATADLAVVTEFWTKSEATLDNDELWVRATQAAGAVVTGTAAVQQLIAFRVRTDSLTAGPYMSVNVAAPGVGAQLGTVLYIPVGLDVRSTPVSMRAGLR